MGKSSGGIRNAGKNTRKSNSINRQVETYSYEYNGEKYTFKIEKNEYKVDRVIEYVNGEKSGRDFNVKSFLENINRSENKNLQKVSSENLLKSSQKQVLFNQFLTKTETEFKQFTPDKKKRAINSLRKNYKAATNRLSDPLFKKASKDYINYYEAFVNAAESFAKKNKIKL